MGMHWVKATTPDGRPTYINLAAVQNIMDRTDAPGSILFLGGISIKADGGTAYATTATKETPLELIALPEIHQDVAAKAVQATGPKGTAKPKAPAKRGRK